MSPVAPEFFQDFAWAVPLAFADPLSDCRFELGDTLYENRAAYSEPWSKKRKTFGHAIQILAPTRGVAGGVGGGDDSAVADSWQQKVEFELYDLARDESRTVVSTQGRLYTLLWKGDLSVLDAGGEEPAIPESASALKKLLPEAVSFFEEELLPDPAVVRFLVPTDSAAGLYREKYMKIRFRLEQEFSATTRLESANGLGLGSEFFPTVQIAFFEMKGVETGAVEKALQDVLYKPSATRKTTDSRFRLQAHGLLF